MKSKLILAVAIVVGIALGLGGGVVLNNNASKNMPCKAPVEGARHYKVAVAGGKVTPVKITAKLCDTLTITNMDSIAREIAFGPHEHHVPYDGVAERVLNDGQSLTITLNQAGSFLWHDHLHDEVQGYFTVSK